MEEVINDMQFYETLENETHTREEIEKRIKDFHLVQIHQLLKNGAPGLLEK